MGDKKYSVELESDSSNPVEITGTNQAECMQKVVEYLIDTQHLLNKINLPYKPGNNITPVIDKIENKPDDRIQLHEVQSEYYLDTLSDKKTKIRELKRLAEKCDIDLKFKTGW